MLLLSLIACTPIAADVSTASASAATTECECSALEDRMAELEAGHSGARLIETAGQADPTGTQCVLATLAPGEVAVSTWTSGNHTHWFVESPAVIDDVLLIPSPCESPWTYRVVILSPGPTP